MSPVTTNHLMIDLETMGTRPNAPILSIGAVYFDPATGTLGEKFYRVIDVADALRYSVPDGNTLRWWLAQSEEARLALINGKVALTDALADLADFYRKSRNAQVWANGPGFDIVILEYAYTRAAGTTAPWDFWQQRCVRTIVELARGKVERPKTFGKGTAHNALDDAVFQAEYVSQMWQALRNHPAPAQAKAAPQQAFDPLEI